MKKQSVLLTLTSIAWMSLISCGNSVATKDLPRGWQFNVVKIEEKTQVWGRDDRVFPWKVDQGDKWLLVFGSIASPSTDAVLALPQLQDTTERHFPAMSATPGAVEPGLTEGFATHTFTFRGAEGVPRISAELDSLPNKHFNQVLSVKVPYRAPQDLCLLFEVPSSEHKFKLVAE